MTRHRSATRTIVVVGDCRSAEVTAAMLTATSIRRDGYALLSADQSGTSGLTGPGFTTVHHLVDGSRRLVIAAAAQAPDWAQILDRADQVVASTTTAGTDADSAEDHLRSLHGWDGRASSLAAGAVVLAHADPGHPARSPAGSISSPERPSVSPRTRTRAPTHCSRPP